MRIWERLLTSAMCGGCGELMAANTPAQMVQIAGMQRRLIRCETCAGEAPPDLPDVMVLRNSTKRMQPLSVSLKAAVDHWKPYKDSE